MINRAVDSYTVRMDVQNHIILPKQTLKIYSKSDKFEIDFEALSEFLDLKVPQRMPIEIEFCYLPSSYVKGFKEFFKSLFRLNVVSVNI